MKMKYLKFLAAMLLFAGMTACSDEPETPGSGDEDVKDPDKTEDVAGFYVLNEGAMGQNNATIDYFGYDKSSYQLNIYPERNPSVVMELGDTGNDIAVYKDRLYAVINGSHKVEVMQAASAERIGQVDISSPRSIVFDGNSAYVSSFVGGDDNHGSVVRFDLTTLKTTGSVSVGYCPEEMVIADGYLYVANSQNYGIGAFDDKISVIKLDDFTVQPQSIKVGCNLRRLRADGAGNLWVVSQGNYADIAAKLYKLPKKGVNDYGTPVEFDLACNNIAVAGKKLYYYTTTYYASWNATYTYGSLNTETGAEEGAFVDETVSKELQTPYCLAVQPENGDIFITDAKNYVSSGALYCLDKDGALKWKVTTGVLPGHIAFLAK